MRAVVLFVAWLAVAPTLGCGVVRHRMAADREEPSVAGAPAANITEGRVNAFDPAVDYFPEKVSVSHARLFSVEYHNHYKVVRLASSAEQLGGPSSDRLVLVQRGTPAPEVAGAAVVEIPVRTLAFNEDTDLIKAKELGYSDRIVAMGGGGIFDPELRERWEQQKIASIGYSFHSAPNFELLLAAAPDLVVLFAASSAHLESVLRARSLGIAAVPSFASSERSRLGSAEWIKFLALFTNDERKAEAHFASIERRYRELASQARAQTDKPSVVWADMAGGGRWLVDATSGEGSLLEDAGGVNVFGRPGGEPDTPVTSEAMIDRAREADIWLCSATTDGDWPRGRFLESFAAWRESKIFHCHKRTNLANDAYDWYETAAARPDLVLADLIAILHPELLPGHELMFFDRQRRGAS